MKTLVFAILGLNLLYIAVMYHHGNRQRRKA
nr:MAG TPA: chitin synthase regulator [Caudoviricetes sp.]